MVCGKIVDNTITERYYGKYHGFSFLAPTGTFKWPVHQGKEHTCLT